MSETRKRLRKLRWKIERYRPDGNKLRRRLIERCESCGQHARYLESWHTHGNRDGKVWHGPCIALDTWRSTAEERLTVLDVITEVWSITSRDVQIVASLREDEWEGRGRFEDLAWRVFYALDQKHTAAARASAGHTGGGEA